MKKVCLLIISTLLLSSCASKTPEVPVAVGVIPDCSTITRAANAAKSLEMPCLDGSEIINFHTAFVAKSLNKQQKQLRIVKLYFRAMHRL